MLGWEYPPRFAGGLGKACQGLSQALAKQGAKVFFVLPTFPERVTERSLEIVGARECLIEAGWEIEDIRAGASRAPSSPPKEPMPLAASVKEEQGGINVIKSEARLFPYGSHPSGPPT